MSRQAEITCPSGLRVKLRSIKGKDLDGLRDKRRLASGEAISTLLDECTIEVIDRSIYAKLPSFDWAHALIGDRMYAVLGLRKATTGQDYLFDVRCIDRDCRRAISWGLNLDELPVKELPEESKEVWANGGNKYIAHVNGKEVIFGLNTGIDQVKFVRNLDKIRSNAKFRQGQANNAERTLLGLAMQVSEVEGLKREEILPWLEDCDLADITKLRKDIEAVDCGVETGINISCPHCGLQQEVELPLDSSFFAGA